MARADSTGQRGGEVIAVTGASNYLGIGLMKLLIDDSRVARLVAIDIHEPDLEHSRLVYHKVDLTSPSSLQVMSNIFTKERITSLVHVIFTYTLSRNRALAHELEAIGTMHVLDACSEMKVHRIVARSTTAVYGAKPGNPNFMIEEHPMDEQKEDSFIHDKIELERQMRQYARHHPECKVAVLRDCTSLGATSINYLSSILLSRRSPRVLGFDPLMQFIHEDDLFRAYHQTLFNEAEGIYNIVGKGVVRYSEAIKLAGGREFRIPEFILRTGTTLLWGMKMYDIPSSFVDHIKYPWVADGTRATRELGYIPAFTCFEALKEARETRRGREA